MTMTDQSGAALSPMKSALLALEKMQAKLDALNQARREPIAIIGMSCRFPGADNVEAFWQLLQQGGDAVIDTPPERWDAAAFYDPDPEAPGKMYCSRGGFIGDVESFDAQFFGISPREAGDMDPQQRLLLEVSWEALERAGQIRDRLAVSDTGVFLGMTTLDYAQLALGPGKLELLDSYHITGNTLNAAAGRIAYTFGFQGPCMAIDTACSSSLVALHQACLSLRINECGQAVVAGVNLMLTPAAGVALSRTRALSPQGVCRAFDAGADGMVRGEGCGVLVLKRLTDAQKDGDNILALVRASAINQDGPSSGLTVPSGPAQEAVIRRALTQAKLKPEQIDYVEAHGTGTPLGDPIEAEALTNVFSKGRPADLPLLLGSVKTNIGHLEACAGMASLIKLVLALQHEQIPQHLHLTRPTPHISWDNTPLRLVTEATRWPHGARPRLAATSGFGLSGVNAHVIVQEAPLVEAITSSWERPLHMLTLSAQSEQSLTQLASRFADFLTQNPGVPLADVCFTANTGRAHFAKRLAVCAADTKELAGQLCGIKVLPISPVNVSLKPAFLFGSQSAELISIGKELYRTQPVFRQALERCCNRLQPLLGKSLFNADTLLSDETGFTWFSVQYALAELWRSWGVEPVAVLGHEAGEYVAAVVAGAFSLEDGLKLLAERGRPENFKLALAQIKFSLPQIGLVSSSTGQFAGTEITGVDYWLRHLEPAAPFTGVLNTLNDNGYNALIEIGQNAGQHLLSNDAVLRLPSWQAGQSVWHTLLHSLGAWYCHGGHIDWAGFDRAFVRKRLVLPTSPWQRERYRLDSAEVTRFFQGHAKVELVHPLLGCRLDLAGTNEIRFTAQLNSLSAGFLSHHRIFKAIVLPASAYLDMAYTAASTVFKTDHLSLSDVVFQQALIVPENGEKQVQLLLTPEASAYRFKIFSLDNDTKNWLEHAAGLVQADDAGSAQMAELKNLQAAITDVQDIEGHYRRCRVNGIDFGSSFQALQKLFAKPGEALGYCCLSDDSLLDAGLFKLHPVLVDCGLQTLAGMQNTEGFAWDQATVYLPINIQTLHVYRLPKQGLWSHARLNASASTPIALSVDLSFFDEQGELCAVIKALQLTRSSPDTLLRALQPSFNDWFYQLDWQQQALNSSAINQRLNGQWLILSDRQGVGRKLAELLSHAGCEVRCVDAPSDTGYDTLLPTLLAKPLQGIVHLWALDQNLDAMFTADQLEASVKQACGSALVLVQAALNAGLPALPEVWLVTQNAQVVTSEELPQPLQSALWGLSRVVAQEHPELHCAAVDLDTLNDSSQNASLLFAEIQAKTPETQVAYRADKRAVARLARLPQSNNADEPVLFKSDASYLITGGLSGLGWFTAQSLLKEGVRHLVLLGRRPAASEIAEQIESFRQQGIQIKTAPVDVADTDKLAELFAVIVQDMPPLKGVFHCAGLLADGMLQNQDWPRFRQVMVPKVNGAWNLHRLTQALSLDFFVLFSSAAALLGTAGQGNYAAANAFMDGLAHYRRAQGLPALSVNWAAWGEIGMAAKLEDRVAHDGLTAIAPRLGFQALRQLLRQHPVQAMVLPVNWPQLAQQWPVGKAPLLLVDLLPVQETNNRSGIDSLSSRFQSLSETERLEQMQTYLHQQIAAALRLNSDKLDINQALNTVGMDSLMAVELRNKLRKDLAVDVSVVKFLDNLSIAVLAQEISQQWSASEATQPIEQAATASISEENAVELLANLESLTDAEIDALLNATFLTST